MREPGLDSAPMTCLDTLTSTSSSSSGLWRAGSTRDAWWMRDEADDEDEVEEAGDAMIPGTGR